jgi:hypothetical protein
MAFQQAQIPVQKTEEFEQLKAIIEHAFTGAGAEKFLRKLDSNNVRIRDFEKAVDKKIFEAVGPASARNGKPAKQLYEALALSDRALIREFYLERIEQVDPSFRERFQKIYRYY